jgi:mycobactin lysine-N-oxygenase
LNQEAKSNQSAQTGEPAHDARVSRPTLLVVGAGPKAVAIAAKRHILAKLGYPMPNLRIIDRQGVATHWTGKAGFTDGQQFLGTHPEKDIGFPYLSACWGDKELSRVVAKEMVHLSWQSFLIDQLRYAAWIDRGRTRPTHREWSQYIQWVAEKVELEAYVGEVTSIATTSDQQWRLTCRVENDSSSFSLTGDGLVMTGPGTPLTIAGQPKAHPRIMDGASFWLHVEEFAQMRSQVTQPLNIGVIGTGETAAAIVVALVDALRDSAYLEVISPYGVIYSRDEGFEENQLFSDPDGRLANLSGDHHHAANWLQMSERDRQEFVRRTDRGVFSLKAMQEISNAENVRSVLGTVRRIAALDTSVRIEIEYDGKTKHDAYDYLVVARGFDALWFRHLLDADTHARLAEVTHSFDGRTIDHAITDDLSLDGFTPKLHLPMLAGIAQGPGFPNLSCLGLLADRILSAYSALASRSGDSHKTAEPRTPAGP